MVIDVFRALARRWYVVVAGLMITGAMVYGAYLVTPPEYNARGLLLLLPSETTVGEGGNPFLSLSGLEQPAGILVAYFSSAPAREEITAQSPTASYQVGIEDSTRGPVIAVDVTDATPEATLGTLTHIIDRLSEELIRLQSDVAVPSDATIGAMSLSVDSTAKPDIAATLRMTIVAAIVGIVLTGIAALALDGILLRRKTRREATPHTARRVSAADEDPDGPAEESDLARGDPAARATHRPRPATTRVGRGR